MGGDGEGEEGEKEEGGIKGYKGEEEGEIKTRKRRMSVVEEEDN